MLDFEKQLSDEVLIGKISLLRVSPRKNPQCKFTNHIKYTIELRERIKNKGAR